MEVKMRSKPLALLPKVRQNKILAYLFQIYIFLVFFLCLFTLESGIDVPPLQPFLGGAFTSVCHFFHPSVCPSVCCAPYLRNRTSTDHNLCYAYVKWWYLQGVFSFFLNFDFLGCKRTKNSLKWKITITSFTRHISETLQHMIMNFGTLV